MSKAVMKRTSSLFSKARVMRHSCPPMSTCMRTEKDSTYRLPQLCVLQTECFKAIAVIRRRQVVGDKGGNTTGSSGHAPYIKGNFQFVRTISWRREGYALLDLRRKR